MDFSIGKNKKGFTFIELLVVIAILGLLASIILVVLNIARLRGKDANIKENLSSLRNLAALYYDTNLNYGTSDVNISCTGVFFSSTNPDVSGIIAAADEQNGDGGIICNTNKVEYAVSAESNFSGKYFCIDSSGYAGEMSTALASGDISCE